MKNFIDVKAQNGCHHSIRVSCINRVTKTDDGCTIYTTEGVIDTIEDYNDILFQLNSDDYNYIYESNNLVL